MEGFGRRTIQLNPAAVRFAQTLLVDNTLMQGYRTAVKGKATLSFVDAVVQFASQHGYIFNETDFLLIVATDQNHKQQFGLYDFPEFSGKSRSFMDADTNIEALFSTLMDRPSLAEVRASFRALLDVPATTDESKAYETKAFGFLELGNKLATEGDMEGAILAYQLSICLHQYVTRVSIGYGDIAPDAYYNLGVILEQVGDLAEAVSAYCEAIRLNFSDSKDAYFNMGNTLMNLGDVVGAINAYNEAIRLDPNYVDVYFNLGNALAAQGNVNMAIKAYRTSISLENDYSCIRKAQERIRLLGGIP